MAEPLVTLRLPEVERMPKVYVEWDEPGAGSLVIDGESAITFNVSTDWEDIWNPLAHAAAMVFIDRLPRWAQEVEHAYHVAKHYEALDAAKDSCIDRLLNGWEPLERIGGWVWITSDHYAAHGFGRVPKPMTPAEIEVMSRG